MKTPEEMRALLEDKMASFDAPQSTTETSGVPTQTPNETIPQEDGTPEENPIMTPVESTGTSSGDIPGRDIEKPMDRRAQLEAKLKGFDTQQREARVTKDLSSISNSLGIPIDNVKTGDPVFKQAINDSKKPVPSFWQAAKDIAGKYGKGIKEGIQSGFQTTQDLKMFAGEKIGEFIGDVAVIPKEIEEFNKKWDFKKQIIEKNEKDPLQKIMKLRELETEKQEEWSSMTEQSQKDVSENAKAAAWDAGNAVVQIATTAMGSAAGGLTKNMASKAGRFFLRTSLGGMQGAIEGYAHGFTRAKSEGLSDEEATKNAENSALWGAMISGGLNIFGGKTFKGTGQRDITKQIVNTSEDAGSIIRKQRYGEPGFIKRMLGGDAPIEPTAQNLKDATKLMEEIPDVDPTNLQKFISQVQKKGQEVYKTLAPKLDKIKIGLGTKSEGLVTDFVDNMRGTLDDYKGQVPPKHLKSIEKALDDFVNAKTAKELWESLSNLRKQMPEDALTGFTKDGNAIVGEVSNLRDLFMDLNTMGKGLIDDITSGQGVPFLQEMKRFATFNRVVDGASTHAREFAKIKGIIPKGVQRAVATGAVLWALSGPFKSIGLQMSRH